MLTPRFSLSQTARHLVVTIHAPFTHVADTEVFFAEKDFRFFSKPYFLRLHLPAALKDDSVEGSEASYDADSQSFVVRCLKETEGEHFEGLDMLSELLRPKGDVRVSEGRKGRKEGGRRRDGLSFVLRLP